MTGGLRKGITLMLLSWLLPCLVSPAPGQPRSFMPVLSSTDGFVELTMISKNNRNTYDGQGFDVSNLYFSEKIGFAGNGYVYDPRFISFLAALTGGLRQEKFEGFTGDSSWNGATVGEYNLWAVLLPEHPYNLQAYTSHAEPFIPGTFAPGSATAVDNRGVIFSYKQNPLFLGASYAENRTEAGGILTDTETYRADGSYALGPFWNSAGYSHTLSHTSPDTRTEEDKITYRNTLNFIAARLDSNVTYSTFTQTGLSAPYLDISRFTWGELATLDLPANLSLNASNTYEYELDRSGANASAELDEDWNRSNSFSSSVSHRLYQSLFTSYAWRSLATESNTGRSKSLSNSLSATYMKRVPRGGFSTGVSWSVTDTESQGLPIILNEPHTAVYPFPDPTFSLNQRNVVESSITIQVIKPNSDPPERYTLLPGMYQIRFRDGLYQVIIADLPEEVKPLVINQRYDFLVTYSTTAAEMENASFQYTLRLNLLDNLLNPYYTYSNAVQTVEAGVIPGGPDRSSSNTAGVMVQRRPYSGTVEYQDFRSRLSPYRAWRTWAEYVNTIAPDTNLRGRLLYEWLDYPPAPAGFRYSGYTQRSTGLDLSVYKVYPREALTLTITGSSRWTRAILDSNAYTLTGSAAWRIGLLTISFNMLASYTETVSPTGTQTIASQNYNLIVTRKLF